MKFYEVADINTWKTIPDVIWCAENDAANEKCLTKPESVKNSKWRQI